MLIKNGDINYPYMILSVNSDTELTLADKPTFSATDTTYTINLTEPNNNSDAARALVAANTYIIYFLQNMDTWLTESGVVEITLPSGKAVKLESIKALQELIEKKGKTAGDKFDKNNIVQETGDATDKVMSQKSVTDALNGKQPKGDYATKKEMNNALSGKQPTGDYTTKTELTKGLNTKLNSAAVKQTTGNSTTDVMSQKACTDNLAKRFSQENFYAGDITLNTAGNALLSLGDGANISRLIWERNPNRFLFRLKDKMDVVFQDAAGTLALTSDIPKMRADSNGYFRKSSPIVKIHPDGSFETNDESEGVNVQRTGVGKYFISGVMGYNADGAWGINAGISVPKNSNGLELIYIKDKILPDGNIEIQTFHRQHSHLPEDFQNWRVKEIINEKPVYYADGEQVDIPPSTWLDIRVEMPVDSIWNRQHAQN
ncbi:hypothetical protein [Arsenophonus apicola]|uniref:Phage tail protein C-terminal domain-containing protein n=1 Tax=Arsenophonus apicola TaxID=2879119 RepID=A0ABY8NYL5_9GAMM|nr:hypothetical protein [Arsenophonus apicola]WGO82345.1 hypothetical protein QG404_01005 [Arsenophonus apicola]